MRIRTTTLVAASLAALMCMAQPRQAAFAQSETPAQEETVVTETAGAAETAAETQAAEEASEQTEAPDLIELGDIKLSGYRKVKWRDYSSSGDFEMFRSANGFSYRDARFEQTSFIMLKGDLPRNLKIDGTFSEMPYQDRTLLLNVTGNNGRARLGDFSTSFPGGSLVSFHKNIRGVDYVYDTGSLRVSAIMSKEKSKTETITFKGQNKRGPYTLNAFQIVEGTEQVKIDGAPVSAGQYYIDYFRGDITFGFVVNAAQTVEITYESTLLLSMKTGNMNAFGVEFTPLNKKFTVGGSFMSEGANAVSQSVLIYNSVDFEVGPFNIDETRSLFTGSMKSPYAFIEKDTELVLRNGTPLSRNTDYLIDYVSGELDFIAPMASSTVSVRYHYFNPKHIGRQRDYLSEPAMSRFTLSKSAVYSGTETVWWCETYGEGPHTDENITCLEMMTPCSDVKYGAAQTTCEEGSDYFIDEVANQIIILNPSYIPDHNHVIRAQYDFVQKTAAEEKASDKKIVDVYFMTKLFDKLSVEAEVSTTDADMSNRRIKVLEEYVATVIVPTQREYCLQRDPATAAEVEIFFDDLVTSRGRKSYPGDFTIETDAGNACPGDKILVFKYDIPAGTTIIANYSVAPDLGTDTTKSASAVRTKIGYSGKKASFNIETISKDMAFSPLNDYSNNEEKRLSGDVKLNLMDNLTLFGDYLTYDNMHNFNTTDKDDYDRIGAGATFRKGRIKEITLKKTRFDASDNLNVSKLDNTRTVDELFFKWDPRGKNVFTVNAELSNSEFEDNTGALTDKDTDRRLVGFGYTPSGKLNVRGYLELTDTDVIAPAGFGADASFGTKTFAKNLDASWTPDDIWSLNSRILLQKKTHSRADYDDENWDSIMLGASARPFGRITFVNISAYRRDLPNNLTGSARTDTANASFGYKAAPMWVVEPSIDKVKAAVGETSSNKSDGYGLSFLYDPDNRSKWDGRFSWKTTDKTNSTQTATTDSEENQYILKLGYVASERIECAMSYDVRRTSPTPSDTDILGFEVRHKTSKRMNSKIGFARTERSSATTETTRDEYIAEAVYTINRTFSVTLNLKKDKYSAGAAAANDYSGTVGSLEVTANF